MVSQSYGDAVQTCNALALDLPDVVPSSELQAVLNTLTADIMTRKNHLSTGILGTKALFPVLTKYNRPDLALAIATQTTYPSYGFMASVSPSCERRKRLDSC